MKWWVEHAFRAGHQPRFCWLCVAASGHASGLLGSVEPVPWRIGPPVGCRRQPALHRTVGPALVAIRALPHQQSLRIALLLGLGLHAYPAVGGAGLAFTDRGGSGYTDGARLYRLRQLCFARPVAVCGSPGACSALQLAGDARERDHGQLCRLACGISSLTGGVGYGSRPGSGAAQQFHRQWWISAGRLWSEWWFCCPAIGAAEHH